MLEQQDQHRIERLRPGQIRAALAHCPVIYMPLGTYEYHQEHLPIGLDALTAQGLCLRAAQRNGGLVCPPFYYGTGGDHTTFPFTVMMPQTEQIEALLEHTLNCWMLSGVQLVVLLSGHFADAQVEMVERISRRWTTTARSMKVLGLTMNMAQNAPMPPDHAGMFETTLLAAFHPDAVDLGVLPARMAGEDVDRGLSPFGKQRLDPSHPLWGVFGPDPRDFDPANCEPLLTAMLSWLSGRVTEAQVDAAASRRQP